MAQAQEEGTDINRLRERIRAMMRAEAPKEVRSLRARLAEAIFVTPATLSNYLSEPPTRNPGIPVLVFYADARGTTCRKIAEEAGIELRPDFEAFAARLVAAELAAKAEALDEKLPLVLKEAVAEFRKEHDADDLGVNRAIVACGVAFKEWNSSRDEAVKALRAEYGRQRKAAAVPPARRVAPTEAVDPDEDRSALHDRLEKSRAKKVQARR